VGKKKRKIISIKKDQTIPDKKGGLNRTTETIYNNSLKHIKMGKQKQKNILVIV
jgi:hypothetical protein